MTCSPLVCQKRMTFLLLRRKLQSWLLYGTIINIHCTICKSKTGLWTLSKTERCTSHWSTEIFQKHSLRMQGLLVRELCAWKSTFWTAWCWFAAVLSLISFYVCIFWLTFYFLNGLLKLNKLSVSFHSSSPGSIFFFHRLCI